MSLKIAHLLPLWPENQPRSVSYQVVSGGQGFSVSIRNLYLTYCSWVLHNPNNSLLCRCAKLLVEFISP